TNLASRQLKAAKPKADSSISSDEDADPDEDSWAENIPVEPDPGSRGNGYGRKRRGSEAAEVAYTVGDHGDGARVDPAPLYNPASVQGLSQEEMRGTTSIIGATPEQQQNASPTDPRAGYLSPRPWETVNGSSPRGNAIAAGDSGLPRMRDLRHLPTRNTPIGSPTSYQAHPNTQPRSTQRPLQNSTSQFARASWEPHSDEYRREVYPRDGEEEPNGEDRDHNAEMDAPHDFNDDGGDQDESMLTDDDRLAKAQREHDEAVEKQERIDREYK
ncbi:MAG: hypothetical protein LQ337_008822, partial [Flavoplaca oasis]